MRTLDQWFQLYGESHQNIRNQIIHEICVPVIFFCVVGFLLLIPWQLGPLRLGEMIILAALLWYATLGVKAFLVMALQLMICIFLFALLRSRMTPWIPLLVLFCLAWVGQFVGHGIEGKRPSFLQDLQFLLIGPLWVLRKLFVKRSV